MRDFPGYLIKFYTYTLLFFLAVITPHLSNYSIYIFFSVFIAGAALSTKSGTRAWINNIILLIAAGVGVGVTASSLNLPIYITTTSISIVVVMEIYTNYLDFQASDLLSSILSLILAGSVGVITTLFVVQTEPNTLVLGAVFGALTAENLRRLFHGRNAWLILVFTALAVTVGVLIPINVSVTEILLALAVTLTLGVTAYLLGAMNVKGVLAGVLLGFATIVAGGYNWFLLLGVFVVLGALSTKYKYEEKVSLGIAEEDRGRRGFLNVMANGSVALASVLLYSYMNSPIENLALLAFAGTIATSTADTLSSELCSVHSKPRLITTLEIVPHGTDGGITLLGEIVTVVAAALIAVLGVLLGLLSPGMAIVVGFGGVVGAHMDSLLGATLEGWVLTNNSVNLGACITGAVTPILIYQLI